MILGYLPPCRTHDIWLRLCRRQLTKWSFPSWNRSSGCPLKKSLCWYSSNWAHVPHIQLTSVLFTASLVWPALSAAAELRWKCKSTFGPRIHRSPVPVLPVPVSSLLYSGPHSEGKNTNKRYVKTYRCPIILSGVFNTVAARRFRYRLIESGASVSNSRVNLS